MRSPFCFNVEQYGNTSSWSPLHACHLKSVQSGSGSLSEPQSLTCQMISVEKLIPVHGIPKILLPLRFLHICAAAEWILYCRFGRHRWEGWAKHLCQIILMFCHLGASGLLEVKLAILHNWRIWLHWAWALHPIIQQVVLDSLWNTLAAYSCPVIQPVGAGVLSAVSSIWTQAFWKLLLSASVALWFYVRYVSSYKLRQRISRPKAAYSHPTPCAALHCKREQKLAETTNPEPLLHLLWCWSCIHSNVACSGRACRLRHRLASTFCATGSTARLNVLLHCSLDGLGSSGGSNCHRLESTWESK